jgi:hypothetical protein
MHIQFFFSEIVGLDNETDVERLRVFVHVNRKNGPLRLQAAYFMTCEHHESQP